MAEVWINCMRWSSSQILPSPGAKCRRAIKSVISGRRWASMPALLGVQACAAALGPVLSALIGILLAPTDVGDRPAVCTGTRLDVAPCRFENFSQSPGVVAGVFDCFYSIRCRC